MLIHQPTPEEASAGIRAVAMVARAPGQISPAVRSLMAAAQKHILGTDYDIDTLRDIDAPDLATAIRRPEIRAQLVNAMVVICFADGEPPPVQAELVERFAGVLGVETPALSTLNRLAHREMLLYKLCLLRNGHLPDAVRDLYRHEGLHGLVKTVLGFKGFVEDPALAATYHALGKLPDNTLGKHFWHHYRSNGFAFPGEKGGFPESGVYHDFSHVLSGYDTSPEGETLVGGFISGYRERRPDHGFFTLLFVLSAYSTGVDVTPTRSGARTGTVGRVAEPLIEAVRRGSRMPTDLSDDWDHWPWVEVSLDEARARLRVGPKTYTGPGIMMP